MASLHQVLVSPLVGGAAVVAIRLANAAQCQGIRTLAWVPGTGPASNALDAAHVPWTIYDLQSLWSFRARQVGVWARMLPRLASVDRPIVHVHNPLVYRIMRPALTIARARVVVHFHLEPDEREVQWALASPPDCVVTCARYIAEKVRVLMGDSGSSCRIVAVPNAIDTNRYLPGARAADTRRRRRHVVLMMANLAPHKGQATALRAVQVLKQRGLEVECWLAGEDRSEARAYEAELHALCAALGVQDQVRFLGFRSDGPELLGQADALLLPSTHEGLPLAVLEAQAAHVPVIGSPIPGILEVVTDGVTGFIADPADPVAYADCIQLVLGDVAVRSRIVSAAARQVVEEHAWAKFEQRIFELYAEVGRWSAVHLRHALRKR